MNRAIFTGLIVVLTACTAEELTNTSQNWTDGTYSQFGNRCEEVSEPGYEWSRDGDDYVLQMQNIAGCGVYSAKMRFEVPDPTSDAIAHAWETTASICNRCETDQYLVWSTYLGRTEEAEDDSTLLGKAGPFYGVGFLGFFRFTDVEGRQSQNQCDVTRGPFTKAAIIDFGDYSPNARQILVEKLEPGIWRTTATQAFNVKRFMSDQSDFLVWRESDYPSRPVDYAQLRSVEYLWPKLRSDPTPIADEFPNSACAELGQPADESFPLGEVDLVGDGVLVHDRGYEDWVFQEIELEFDDDYLEYLMSRTWISNSNFGGPPR